MEPIVKWQLRLPLNLHMMLHDQAEQNGRSLNREIVWRLKQSIGPLDRPLTSAELLDEIEDAAKRIQELAALVVAAEEKSDV